MFHRTCWRPSSLPWETRTKRSHSWKRPINRGRRTLHIFSEQIYAWIRFAVTRVLPTCFAVSALIRKVSKRLNTSQRKRRTTSPQSAAQCLRTHFDGLSANWTMRPETPSRGPMSGLGVIRQDERKAFVNTGRLQGTNVLEARFVASLPIADQPLNKA